MTDTERIRLGTLLLETSRVIQISLVERRDTFCHAAMRECRDLVDTINQRLEETTGDQSMP